jgi:hypothetical protein
MGLAVAFETLGAHLEIGRMWSVQNRLRFNISVEYCITGNGSWAKRRWAGGIVVQEKFETTSFLDGHVVPWLLVSAMLIGLLAACSVV